MGFKTFICALMVGGCAAPTPTPAPRSVSVSPVVPGGGNKWDELEKLVNKLSAPPQYQAAAALQPVSASDLDKLWALVDDNGHLMATQLLGVVAKQDDTARMLEILEGPYPTAKLHYEALNKYFFIMAAVGIQATRSGPLQNQCIQALENCADPSSLRSSLGTDVVDSSIATIALRCAAALHWQRTASARATLKALSDTDFQASIGERQSRMFRVEARALVHRLDVLSQYSGTIEDALEGLRSDDPTGSAKLEALSTALDEMGMTLDEVLKD